MWNKRVPGFTLIEILVAMVVIALLAAIAIPNLGPRRLRAEREQFVAQINAMTQYAWQQAIITNMVHKVQFDLQKRTITLLATKKGQEKESDFKLIAAGVVSAEYEWPEQFVIKQFFIQGFDEVSKSGKKTTEIWFFIMPEGLAQDVIINFIDTADLVNQKPRQVGLVLNPFSAQFASYDTFQK